MTRTTRAAGAGIEGGGAASLIMVPLDAQLGSEMPLKLALLWTMTTALLLAIEEGGRPVAQGLLEGGLAIRVGDRTGVGALRLLQLARADGARGLPDGVLDAEVGEIEEAHRHDAEQQQHERQRL